MNRQSPPITTCHLSCVIKVPERQQSPLIRNKLVRRAFTLTSTFADLCTHTQHTLADIRLGLRICRVLGRIPALTHAARPPVQEGVTRKPILVRIELRNHTDTRVNQEHGTHRHSWLYASCSATLPSITGRPAWTITTCGRVSGISTEFRRMRRSINHGCLRSPTQCKCGCC